MDLDDLKRKRNDLLRQWHLAEEHWHWQEAERLLARAEALGEKIERMEKERE